LITEKLLLFLLRYCQFDIRVENQERRGSCPKMQNLQLNMLCNHIMQTLINGVECGFAVNAVH